MNKAKIFGWAALFMALLGPAAFAAEPVSAKPAEQTVSFAAINPADYQNFLKNWDEAKQPVFLALIRTPEEYAAIFSPAPIMRDQRPFAPEASLYAKEQIIVVSRVTAAPGTTEKVLEIERISAKGQKLNVYYRYLEPTSKATYTVKNVLAVRIAQANYKKVRFFENGKNVGELRD